MKPGTQIIYVPTHANGIHSPEADPGFVTSVTEGGAFCRYWSKHEEGSLRTTTCSELTPIDRLTVQDTHPQTEVDRLMRKFGYKWERR